MSNNIVVVNVTQTQAPIPSTLQQSGAFISQGGTTTAEGTLTLLTSLSSLTSILEGTQAMSAISWSSGTVTVTVSGGHGWPVGDIQAIVIAGVTPSGYNGTFQGTVTSTTQVTYPLASNPGGETVLGTIILASESELYSMANTYFAGNGVNSVYVLELGPGSVATNVANLQAWITANPNTIYSYLIPRGWDGNSTFLAFLGDFTAANAKTYFFVTTKLANINYYAPLKCVLAEVEAPSIPATEFSLASAFATTLSYNPNSTNRVTPISYAFAYGVTAYPLPGNQSVFTELKTANVGYIGTGAEGGITNTILLYGQMQDGNPFNYWYSTDWAQLNIDLSISNEIINGSNNPLAPLYYDQNGINRLQNRAAQVLGTAITNGLALGTVVITQLSTAQFSANYEAGLYEGQLVINAEPFVIYNQENPNDYAIGKYAGLACVYTPSRGFNQIFFLLNVTNLIA